MPKALLPPAIPFTLHVTAVSEVLVTEAVKVAELPRRIAALDGLTATATA